MWRTTHLCVHVLQDAQTCDVQAATPCRDIPGGGSRFASNCTLLPGRRSARATQRTRVHLCCRTHRPGMFRQPRLAWAVVEAQALVLALIQEQFATVSQHLPVECSCRSPAELLRTGAGPLCLSLSSTFPLALTHSIYLSLFLTLPLSLSVSLRLLSVEVLRCQPIMFTTSVGAGILNKAEFAGATLSGDRPAPATIGTPQVHMWHLWSPGYSAQGPYNACQLLRLRATL